MHSERLRRLLRPRDFEAVLAGGDACWRGRIVVRARVNGLNFPRLGIILGKKAMSRAVDRNRSKRLIRESFRAAQHALPAADIVVQFLPGDGTRGAITWAEARELFTRLGR